MRARVALLVIVAGVVSGCAVSIPSDPDGTLERVRGGQLRVGVSVSEPWTSWAQDEQEPGGVEADLVRDFADHLGAEVVWTRGGEGALMRELERRQLEVVIGGLTSTAPWSSKAALTAVYTRSTGPDGEERGHVMATVMGENAFLAELEQFLRAQDVEP